MGQCAQSLLAANGVKIVIAPGDESEKIAAAWLAGALQSEKRFMITGKK